MNNTLREKGLEELIEKHLLNCGYVRGGGTYEAAFCMEWPVLRGFLETTQPEALERVQKSEGVQWEDKLRSKIMAEVGKRGLADVLRSGVLAGAGERLRLYFPRPATETNPRAVKLWQDNRFGVARQVYYSVAHPLLSLDMVLFVNGLPAVTMELKNAFTGQNVNDAKRQYQNDRDPKEALFAMGRCVVHFAVDSDLVFMAAQLSGKSTHFLPFNKGFNGGAGNPPNPNGLKTDYLWKETALLHESILTQARHFLLIFQTKYFCGIASAVILLSIKTPINASVLCRWKSLACNFSPTIRL